MVWSTAQRKPQPYVFFMQSLTAISFLFSFLYSYLQASGFEESASSFLTHGLVKSILSDLFQVFQKCQPHALKLHIFILEDFYFWLFLFLNCSFKFHPNLHTLIAGGVKEAESMKYQMHVHTIIKLKMVYKSKNRKLPYCEYCTANLMCISTQAHTKPCHVV